MNSYEDLLIHLKYSHWECAGKNITFDTTWERLKHEHAVCHKFSCTSMIKHTHLGGADDLTYVHTDFNDEDIAYEDQA